MNSGSNSAGGPGLPKPDNMLDQFGTRIEAASDRAMGVCHTLDGLGDRAFGPVPEDMERGGDTAAYPSGVTGQITMSLDRLDGIIGRLAAGAERLQKLV